MSGPTTRDFVSFIDRATERKPNEIEISGTRDGKPTSSIWRIEKKRIMPLEVTWDGKKVTGGGRWIDRCGAE